MIYFFILSISFICTFLITPSIRFFALKSYAIDRQSLRKIHKKIITRLGGIAIYFGFISGVIVFIFLDSFFFKSHIFQFGGLIICSTLMLMLGIYDDFMQCKAVTKLCIQTVIALLLIQMGFRLERIFIPGLLDLRLGVLSTPITLLWLLGITNAINLIDGLDGLAGGMVAIIAFFFALYGFLLKKDFVVYSSLALLGANLAFLRYNFYPAKLYMGDTGSLFLGFTIGSIGCYRASPESLANFLFIPTTLILFLPISDTIFSIFRRFYNKQHIFGGDLSHIHHYCINHGFSQIKTVKRFYLITFCMGIISLYFIYIYANFLYP